MKANQLSKTAAFIAIKFYGLTRIKPYRSLFDESIIKFYEKLVEFLPAPLKWYHKWLNSKWIRKFYIWCEELLLPGDLMHIIARKWYIGQIADKLVDEGYEQLIVLGAGFDHLAFHYSQKGLSCFEFDTPRMAEVKQSFLTETYPNSPLPKVIDSHFPADNFEQLLQRQQELDSPKKTMIVAEGFFDYIPFHTVNTFFITLKEYFSHNFAIISTHFALDELPRFHQNVFRTSVNLVGEQLQFNSSISQFRELFKSQKLTVTKLIDRQEVRESFLQGIRTPLPVLKGFYILLAKPDENNN